MREMLEFIFIVSGLFFVLVVYVLIKLYSVFHTASPVHARLDGIRDAWPSVTVCIPARNETHAMTSCLESVLASDYPKLEIVVLDDGSTDNTSFLIKSFAHEGVRFVEGSPLPTGWLGKNHALQGLLDQSSGAYILFMDVDTRLQPATIEQMVACLEADNAAMLSVLPQRPDGLRASVLLSPLRYLWELLLHRQAKPAAASAAWMIDRHVLRDQLGGLAPYALDTQPESSLAAALAADNRYRFMISSPKFGVSYEKKLSSQIETSIRLLYPRLGGRPYGALLALTALILAWLPMAGLLLGWLFDDMTLVGVALPASVLMFAIYGLYLSRVRQSFWWVAVWLWPIVITQEIVLLTVSMTKYARGTVTWKGRDVIAPKLVRRMKEDA
jgi:cellulose synthase/poly-beta-1,6-N-acetylglucosamine synthase-like glycosyltransferase